MLLRARALAVRFELARGDGLETTGMFQRDDVAGALLHRCSDDVLVDLIARDQYRNFGAELLADRHDLRRIGGIRTDKRDQHVRTDLLKRIAKVVELPDPVASNRVACIAQGAVDGFDVVLMSRQDDHRHSALFGQRDSPGERLAVSG